MELTIRYREGLNEEMRVRIDEGSDWYQISAPLEEIGRREGLRIILEKINS
jgi:hypothetical protein